MDQTKFIFWAITTAAIVFMFLFATKRTRETKKLVKQQTIEYEEKRQKYTYLKPGIFDEIPREDVTAAALFHCMRKEDEDFENYFSNMNESEKIIYGVYLIGTSLNDRNPSLHSFFITPSNNEFVPIADKIFEDVGSHEIAVMMKAARRFSEIIENDLEEEENDPELGDYALYNFSDFTNEYLTLANTTNLGDKMIEYVLAHKEDFYDYNIPDERGDDFDERIGE